MKIEEVEDIPCQIEQINLFSRSRDDPGTLNDNTPLDLGPEAIELPNDHTDEHNNEVDSAVDLYKKIVLIQQRNNDLDHLTSVS